MVGLQPTRQRRDNPDSEGFSLILRLQPQWRDKLDSEGVSTIVRL